HRVYGERTVGVHLLHRCRYEDRDVGDLGQLERRGAARHLRPAHHVRPPPVRDNGDPGQLLTHAPTSTGILGTAVRRASSSGTGARVSPHPRPRHPATPPTSTASAAPTSGICAP